MKELRAWEQSIIVFGAWTVINEEGQSGEFLIEVRLVTKTRMKCSREGRGCQRSRCPSPTGCSLSVFSQP